jgi:tetratricopeptide (TPR) repeat protein
LANLYDILEMPLFSSLERVKKQYKVLAFRYHPDVHQGDDKYEEKFKAVSSAYIVLSDPRQKLAYDQVLYRRMTNTKNGLNRSPERKIRRNRTSGYPIRRKKRERASVTFWVLTVFAFGFFFYQMIYQLNNYLDAKKIEQKITTRGILFEQAQIAFENGDYKMALDYLDLVNFDQSGMDLINLRKTYLEASENKASELMEAGQYAHAREYLSLLITRANRAKEEWYIALAICYKKLGKITYSIELLENLLKKNPNLLLANKEIAFIYKNDLTDFEKSLYYLERATAIIVNNYIDHYGKAYFVVIDPKNHPPTDFNVFLEKARIYSTFKRPEDAISACKWAEVLNPESPEPNILMGRCYFEAGEYPKACKAIKKARKKGGKIPEELRKINC